MSSHRPTPTDATAPAQLRAADRVRAAARELFYGRGIRAVGVEEIVSRAGVTKPSLYRAFPSKDDLAAVYLSDYDREFWPRFETPGGRPHTDARAQVLAYIADLAARAVQDGYRGCGLSNAAVEYPGHSHPARRVAERHKQALRQRLRELAAAMGARDPQVLGDGLMLLIEGVYMTGQQSANGPAQSALAAATALIDASTGAGAAARKKSGGRRKLSSG